MSAPARRVLPAIWRGFRGKCPGCGRGAILSGYASPIRACPACGENLAPYRTADFAPYLVTFATGLIFVPLIVALTSALPSATWVAPLTLVCAAVTALILLPRAKGSAVGLMWALDVRSD